MWPLPPSATVVHTIHLFYSRNLVYCVANGEANKKGSEPFLASRRALPTSRWRLLVLLQKWKKEMRVKPFFSLETSIDEQIQNEALAANSLLLTRSRRVSAMFWSAPRLETRDLLDLELFDGTLRVALEALACVFSYH